MKPSSTAVSLLLANLRLLGYGNGSEESFPITPDVFTSLKNKGKAFEHIVYHLLHILDPEECTLRLEGCWPIYEPAQSRELRNIVFKWLTDLKKNGQLGGNILVRRTLLDDCSGDRYEELLLSLSTAVLRDQIGKGNFQDTNRKTFAYKQASSLNPSPKSLTVLVFAYQSSLTRLLHSRRLSKSQWSSFSSFLDSKESKISTISENPPRTISVETPRVLPRGYEEEILRKWRNNWLGDQRWLEILLKGDPEYMRDRFFELSFEKALAKHHHFKNGLVGMSDGDVSLQALERQVQEQKSRLIELRQMREAVLRVAPKSNTTISPRAVAETEAQARKYLKVVFDQHQRLHSDQLKIRKDYLTIQRNEYTELMDSLREDLIVAGVPRRHEVTSPAEYLFQAPPREPPKKCGRLGLEGKPFGKDNELSENEINILEYSRCDSESDHEVRPLPPPQGQYDRSDNPLIKVTQQIEEYVPHSATPSDISYEGNDDEGFSAFEESIIISEPPTNHANPPQPPPQDKSLMWDSLGFGDDELIAEQIVSRMTATNFSPEKPSPIKRNQQRLSYKPPPLDDTFDMDENSLSLSIYQPQNTRHQDEQTSFSYLAENLTTPARNPTTSPTRKEDLLLSSDYHSVFKSRPKIAVSPTLVPAGGSPRTLPNLSLMSGIGRTPEILSEDDMVGFTAEHAPSPLLNKNGRRGKM